METLRELTGEYLALMELGGSDDPEDQQAFLDTLEGINFEVGLKADNYADVIAAFNDRYEQCKAEAARLSKRAKMFEAASDRMKDVLKNAMLQMDKNKIETDYHTFKVRKNGGKQKLTIPDQSKVPDRYKKIELVVDNDKIRSDLEAGVELDWAFLEERGTSLSIS